MTTPWGLSWGINPAGEGREAESVNERGSCAVRYAAAARKLRPPRGKSTLPGVKVSERALSDATGCRALTSPLRGSSSPRPRPRVPASLRESLTLSATG